MPQLLPNAHPQYARGQRALIQERLRVHALLTSKFQADGLDQNAASLKAFQEIRDKPARDLDDTLRKHGLAD